MDGQLPDLQGPMTPDQPALLVIRSHFDADTDFNGVPPVSDLEGGVIAIAERGAHLQAKFSPEKYDSSLALVWSKPLSFSATKLSVRKAGDIFVAGTTEAKIAEDDHVGQYDVVVARYAGDGTLGWIHTWGSDLLDSPYTMSGSPDGSVVGLAGCNGQAPGHGPENAGELTFFRYDSAGARTILRQAPDYSRRVDRGGEYTGDLYVHDDGAIRYGVGNMGPATSGTRTVRDGVRWLDPLDGTPRDGGSVTISPQDCLMCGGTSRAIGANQHVAWLVALAGISRDGDSLWFRNWETRKAVLDTAAGREWTGRMMSGEYALVESSGLVLGGQYHNTYRTGCEYPVSGATPAFIGKYSPTGDRIWFQEYATDFSSRSNDFDAAPLVTSVVPLGDDYGVFMSARKLEAGSGRGRYMFKIKGTDGTLLP